MRIGRAAIRSKPTTRAFRTPIGLEDNLSLGVFTKLNFTMKALFRPSEANNCSAQHGAIR